MDTAGEMPPHVEQPRKTPQAVSHAEQIGITSREVQNTVQEVFVQTSSHSSKRSELDGPLNVSIPDGKGGERLLPAKASRGGQDAAGAMVFNGGFIDAVLIAADGCSFGDKENTAKAAQLTVEKMLKVGRGIAGNSAYSSPDVDPETRRDNILKALTEGVIDSHRQIRSEAPGGATTLVTAAISREEVRPGKYEYYLYAVSCGDSQVMILSRDKHGNPQLRKLVAPADSLDKQMRDKFGDIEDWPVNLANLSREEIILEFAEKKGVSIKDARDALTNSGIYAFLGGNVPVDKSANDTKTKASNLGIRSFRINLSEDRFTQGHTDVRVIACSDNAGEKIPETEIKKIYAESPGNLEFTRRMNDLMTGRNEDDGSLVIAKVGAPPITVK